MGFVERHQASLRLFQRLLDPAVAALALWACAAAAGHDFERAWIVLAALSALAVATVFEAAQVYRPWRAAPVHQELTLVTAAWLAVAAVLAGLAWLTQGAAQFPEGVLHAWLVATPAALAAAHLAVRLGLRALRLRGRNLRTYVIVGGGDLGGRLHSHVAARGWLGLRGLGYFDDRAEPRGADRLPLPRLGALADLAAFVRRESPHYVFLALPPGPQAVVKQVLDGLAGTTASVYLLPDVFAFEPLPAGADEDVALVALREQPFAGVRGALKRAEDLVLASLILAFISPLLLAIAAAVKLTSPGPVLFRQGRYGLDGRVFRVWKFRSMTVCEDGADFVQARRGDARVTPLGAFLRRTSLDELPQFVNVLAGDMSIVGPRPSIPDEVRQYQRWQRRRLSVKPGITCTWQVSGRSDIPFDQWMRLDLEYIDSWSFWQDIRICLRTVPAVLLSRGAH